MLERGGLTGALLVGCCWLGAGHWLGGETNLSTHIPICRYILLSVYGYK